MALHQGDCLDVLKTLPENSIDVLVTDPPAGISFMGKNWDHHKGGRKEWCAWLESVMRECMRVMKPGAHGLVWALPRTSHWTATALEDAGFEIRDCIYHLFGSGFPKSLDVSKAIDKAAGLKRDRIPGGQGGVNAVLGSRKSGEAISGEAKRWQGFGTALKPAVECWWLVRRPLSEKTVAANVLKWGTGALNIDGNRVEPSKDYGRSAKNSKGTVNAHDGFEGKSFKIAERDGEYASPLGRFPSHLILDEEAGAMLDAQSGNLHGAGNKKLRIEHNESESKFGMGGGAPTVLYDRGGGASRFFYCAKVSASERNAGLDGMPDVKQQRYADGTKRKLNAYGEDDKNPNHPRKNHHPTVKPQKLMRYLCKLITPPGGTILDPFMGSGSTGLAARTEGFGFVGIEKEAEYFEIAKARLAGSL